jgi:hypothetical protein
MVLDRTNSVLRSAGVNEGPRPQVNGTTVRFVRAADRRRIADFEKPAQITANWRGLIHSEFGRWQSGCRIRDVVGMTYRPHSNQKFDWSDHEMIQPLGPPRLDPVPVAWSKTCEPHRLKQIRGRTIAPPCTFPLDTRERLVLFICSDRRIRKAGVV